MKVILLQDDKTLGKRGAIVTVSDGFAFNNLIPRGIAKAATAHVIREAEARERKRHADAQSDLTQRRALAKQIHKKTITIAAKAKETKLFGSITAKDIVTALAAQHNHVIVEKAVMLDTPIKDVTTREVRIDFGDGVTSAIIVKVTKA